MNKKLFLKFTIAFFILVLLTVMLSIGYKAIVAKKQTDPINIVYITDNNYATYMRTSMRSVIANKKPNTHINIYVIGQDLSTDNIKNIKKEKRKNITIIYIPLKQTMIDLLDKGSWLTPFVSKVDNAKLFLPSILSSLDKVILLDVDTIVLKDLSDLYSIDLKDNYIAAADDWRVSTWTDNNTQRYFNNGVMLLNLKKMRADGIESKLINRKFNDKKIAFVTQDAYNSVINDKVLYLPLIYNTFAMEFDDKNKTLLKIKKVLKNNYDPNLYPYKTLKEFQKNVIVIHYCGPIKPWHNIDYKSKANIIWYKYAPLDFWKECQLGKCKSPY